MSKSRTVLTNKIAALEEVQRQYADAIQRYLRGPGPVPDFETIAEYAGKGAAISLLIRHLNRLLVELDDQGWL